MYYVYYAKRFTNVVTRPNDYIDRVWNKSESIDLAEMVKVFKQLLQ